MAQASPSAARWLRFSRTISSATGLSSSLPLYAATWAARNALPSKIRRPRRDGRVVECGRLEICCTHRVPGVRIPLSPPLPLFCSTASFWNTHKAVAAAKSAQDPVVAEYAEVAQTYDEKWA